MTASYNNQVMTSTNEGEITQMAILNADGVYIATIYTLLMCLNMSNIQKGVYENEQKLVYSQVSSMLFYRIYLYCLFEGDIVLHPSSMAQLT